MKTEAKPEQDKQPHSLTITFTAKEVAFLSDYLINSNGSSTVYALIKAVNNHVAHHGRGGA